MKNYFREFKGKIKHLKKISRKENKKTAFFISNTKKYENVLFYTTPIRKTVNYIYFGVVLFDDRVAKKIAKIVDGNFNVIFVDTEKKSFKLTKDKVVNVERTIKENIKKTYLRFYKANDLTINAAEDLLAIHFRKEIRNLSGKKILIIGTGNIGFKLSLRLIERGSEVHLFRRNEKKLVQICNVLNFIKPLGTIAKAKKIKYLKKNLSQYDVIFCTANQKNIMKINNIKEFKKNVLLVDIGKGMFDSETLKLLIDSNIIVHRLDVTPSLNMLLEGNDSFKEYEKNKSYLIKKRGNFRLVSQGLLGQKNDLIVDNPISPNTIFGVCDGMGDFLRLDNSIKSKILNSLSKVFKKKINFD